MFLSQKIKKIALVLIIGTGVIKAVPAQTVFKVGDNPFIINSKAVIEVESTTRGFLPPRMTKVQRDAISPPIPAGLQVWCSDCNISTNSPSGELCVYTGTAWAPLMMFTTSRLTTAKRTDPTNKPIRVSATSATIKGTLVSTSGVLPTETGVVWKEITGNDFAVLPVLNDSGRAIAPDYKTTTTTAVTNEGGAISVTIPNLISTTSSKRPFSFRTYAKSPAGIGYGNSIIFNAAPPAISEPVVTNGNSLSPVFKGILNINAGTPAGTITEYGYYSGANNPPMSNKKLISDGAAISALDARLNSDSFTADPTVDLAVNDYKVVASGASYFRYYVVANGETIYSSVVNFTPPDLVSGGDAVAAIPANGIEIISKPLKIDDVSGSVIKVHFNVTKAGSYDSFVPEAATGATTGLSVATVPAGSFTTGDNVLTFIINGVPGTSLDGNTFSVPRIGTLTTGTILPDPVTGGGAVAAIPENGIEKISKQPKIGEVSTSVIKVHFNVTKAGSYGSFVPEAATGTTTGLSMATVPAGTFIVGDNVLTFIVNGTPNTSLGGNSFNVPRVGMLTTGRIKGLEMVGSNATCDAIHETTVVNVYSPVTKKTWMDRNLGASHTAISATDYEAFGCLYQWGRGNDGHASIKWNSSIAGTPVNRTTGSQSEGNLAGNALFVTNSFDWRTTPNNNLWQSWTGEDAGNNPCPSGYRVPSYEEFTAEIAAYSIKNTVTAYNSDLKFTKNRLRNYKSGDLSDGRAFYWTSTVVPNISTTAFDFTFTDSSVPLSDKNAKSYGFGVRCIKN